MECPAAAVPLPVRVTVEEGIVIACGPPTSTVGEAVVGEAAARGAVAGGAVAGGALLALADRWPNSEITVITGNRTLARGNL